MGDIMDITSFSAIVAAISVVVGVIFAILQMRDATKIRHTSLVIQLNPALNTDINDLLEASKKIWSLEFNSYEEYLKKYGNPMSDKAIVTIASYYDGLGFLLYKRLITDIDIIEYFTEGAIIQIWEKLKPIIVGMRKAINSPELFKSFEYLYQETKKT
jgi:hypothetical protein